MSGHRLGAICAALSLTGACIETRVVTCSDGRVCPGGTVCDPVGHTCVDPAGLAVQTAGLDFGDVACGATPALPISVGNFGMATVAMRAYPTSGDLTVTPATAMVSPGQVIELEVRPALDRRPGPIDASIVVASAQQLIEVPVSLVSTGALVLADRTVVDFGDQTVGQRGDEVLVLRNDGNRDIEVVATIPSGPFQLAAAGSILIAPGAEEVVGVAFAPTAAEEAAGQLGLDYVGVLCARAPTAVALQGVGDASGVLLDQTTLTFEGAGCGAAATSKTVTLTNNVGAPVALAARIVGPDAARFGPPSLSAAAIPAGGVVTVTVPHLAMPTTLPLPLKDEDATLLVDVTIGMTIVPKQVALSRRLLAPHLSLTPSALDFGTVPIGSIGILGVRMDNAGTTAASVATPALPFAGLRITPAIFTLAAGRTQELSVSLAPVGITSIVLDGLTVPLGASGDCGAGASLVLDGIAGGDPF